MNTKISFQGKEYWRVENAITPLEHCDENGELVVFFEESYAHIFNDGVYRFGKKIGEVEEVKDLKAI